MKSWLIYVIFDLVLSIFAWLIGHALSSGQFQFQISSLSSDRRRSRLDSDSSRSLDSGSSSTSGSSSLTSGRKIYGLLVSFQKPVDFIALNSCEDHDINGCVVNHCRERFTPHPAYQLYIL